MNLFPRLRGLLVGLGTLAIGVSMVACSGDKPAAGPAETPKTEASAAATPETAKPADPAAGAEAVTPKAAPAVAADPHAAVAAAPADTPLKRVEGPVAIVNGTPIPATELYSELDKITARGAKIPRERLLRIQQNILKRLVEKELVRQAVETDKIAVAPADIDSAFAEYKKRFQTEEQFQNYLKHGRVDEASIRARLTEKNALEKLIEAKGSTQVNDEESKEFYVKNERFYIEKEGVRARHILIKVAEKASAEEEAAALETVKAVQKALAKGDDFAELAKTKSEGPSAPKGGDLGFFGRGQMVKPFEEAAFKLKVGDQSGPVRTRFGFHIIMVEEKREERKKPFAEVKDQIVQSLKNKKFFQQRRDLLQTLREGAKVDIMVEEPAPPKPAGATGKVNPHAGRGGDHDQGHGHEPIKPAPAAVTPKVVTPKAVEVK